jgi:hypothetical protein
LSWTFTVLCLVFGAIAIGYGTWLAVWRREMIGLLMLVSGLLAATFEPLADLVGVLWFASDNIAITIELMGRHIPLYVVVGYMFFFGLISYIDYRAIALGMARKYFLISMATAFGFDWFLQSTGASFSLYEYYGNDPFRILGAPVWWFTMDIVSTLLIAYLLFTLRHRLVGWGRLLVIGIVPVVYAGWNGAAGFPIFIAKNSNFDAAVNGNGSTGLVLLGGFITIGICAVVAWVVLGEIGRAQERAGVQIRSQFSLRELLFAPLPRHSESLMRPVGSPKGSATLQNR